MGLTLRPTTIKAAREFVAALHRHNAAPNGGLFATSVVDSEDTVRGVAIIATPVAMGNADGWTCEVTRCCTDGSKNACSMLYGAAARAAKALGYKRILTYTLASEPGTALRAAGWREVAKVRWRPWNHSTRKRETHIKDLFGGRSKYSMEDKVRWERELG